MSWRNVVLFLLAGATAVQGWSMHIRPSGERLLNRLTGENFLVVCSIVDYDGAASDVQVNWIRDNEIIRTGRIMTIEKPLSSQLMIVHAKKEDSGEYVCQAKLGGEIKHASASISFIKAPKFVDPKTEQHPEEGTDAEITCKVDAEPGVEIFWQFNGQTLGQTSLREYNFKEDGQVLIIPHFEAKKDDGLYLCNVAQFSTFHVLNISVVGYSRPVITVFDSPKNNTGYEGQAAEFKCGATGKPKPTYKWFKVPSHFDDIDYEQPKEDEEISASDMYTVEDGLLVVNSLSADDEGKYKCVATNDVGSTEKVAEFNVFLKPSVEKLTNEVKQDGEDITFTCKYRGEGEVKAKFIFGDDEYKPGYRYLEEQNDSENSTEEGEDAQAEKEEKEEGDEEEKEEKEENSSDDDEKKEETNEKSDSGEQSKSKDDSNEENGEDSKDDKTKEDGGEEKDTEDKEEEEKKENTEETVEEDKKEDDSSSISDETNEVAKELEKDDDNDVEVKEISGDAIDVPDEEMDSEGVQTSTEDNEEVLSTTSEGNDENKEKAEDLNDEEEEVKGDSNDEEDKEEDEEKDEEKTWKKFKRDVAEQRIVVSEDDGQLTLTIKRLSLEDAGDYQCVVENEAGQTTKTANLAITHAPSIISHSRHSTRVIDGEEFSLECTASAVPDAVWKWIKDGSEIEADGTSIIIGSDADSSKITVKPGAEQYGNFKCVASNGVGEPAHEEMKVLRVVKPSIPPAPSCTEHLFPNYGACSFPEDAFEDEDKNSDSTPSKITFFFAPMDLVTDDFDWNAQARNVTVDFSDEPMRLPELSTNSAYAVRSIATNEAGESEMSPQGTVETTDPWAPEQPIEVIVVCTHSCKVSWKEPNNHGAPISEYIIFVRERSEEDGIEKLVGAQRELVASAEESSLEIPGLKPDTKYEVAVVAANSVGRSEERATTITTPDTVSSSPFLEQFASAQIITVVIVIFAGICLLIDIFCCCVNKCGVLACLFSSCMAARQDHKKTADLESGRGESGRLLDGTTR